MPEENIDGEEDPRHFTSQELVNFGWTDTVSRKLFQRVFNADDVRVEILSFDSEARFRVLIEAGNLKAIVIDEGGVGYIVHRCIDYTIDGDFLREFVLA